MPDELKINIIAAIKNAGKELSRFRTRPEQALKYLEPYRDIDVIDGIQKSASDVAIGLYSAVVADCYRENGDFLSAAQWYKRASTFCMNCGFANLYAEMVIKNKFSDYYTNALMCVDQSRNIWKSKPLHMRIYWQLVALCRLLRHPWDIPKMVYLEFNSKSFIQKLKLLISQKINNHP